MQSHKDQIIVCAAAIANSRASRRGVAPDPNILDSLSSSELSELIADSTAAVFALKTPDVVDIHSPKFTARQREILALIQQGMTNLEISRRLGVSVPTIKIHVGHIFDKTGARRRRDLQLPRLGRAALRPDGQTTEVRS